jgi:branched-chain amino acid transport system permease protein
VLAGGLSLSGYYALLAVGFGLIFATLRIFHIAHAAVFGTGAYSFYLFHRVLQVGLFPSALLSIAAAAIVGLVVDRIIYLPILRRGGGLFAVFIASLGVALLFEATALLFTRGQISVARVGTLDLFTLGPLSLRWLDVIVIVLASLLYGGLYMWIMRTRMGLEIRALADNPSLAGVVGIDTRQTRTFIFLCASALAGVAGVLTAYDNGIVPTTGLNLLFITMVAVIFGGSRYLFLGALGGSLVMGVVTALASYWAPSWVTISVFALLIALLIARPNGLFGS